MHIILVQVKRLHFSDDCIVSITSRINFIKYILYPPYTQKIQIKKKTVKIGLDVLYYYELFFLMEISIKLMDKLDVLAENYRYIFLSVWIDKISICSYI